MEKHYRFKTKIAYSYILKYIYDFEYHADHMPLLFRNHDAKTFS